MLNKTMTWHKDAMVGIRCCPDDETLHDKQGTPPLIKGILSPSREYPYLILIFLQHKFGIQTSANFHLSKASHLFTF